MNASAEVRVTRSPRARVIGDGLSGILGFLSLGPGGGEEEGGGCVSWIRPQEIVDFYGLSRFSNLALIFHADAANV